MCLSAATQSRVLPAQQQRLQVSGYKSNKPEFESEQQQT